MQSVINVVKAMAELYEKKLSDATVTMLISDLRMYSEKELLHSLEKCRNDCKYFPSISEIKERIPDGHPTPNEAWAMLPKNEELSYVWTDEMRKAYNLIADLLYEDKIAARVAFIEKYKELVSEAKKSGKKAHYTTSLGHDKESRKDILRIAAEKNAYICGDVAAALEYDDSEKNVINIEHINKLLPQK